MLGSFAKLLPAVTRDPAMLIWLSGVDNTKDAPNENYGREMMELFTLGADRSAYTERDVREQARSLTGWTSRWSRRRGEYFCLTRRSCGGIRRGARSSRRRRTR